MPKMNKQLLSPFQKFVRIESFGGILLLLATIVALVWANSPLGDAYDSLWNYKLGIKTPDIDLIKPLRLWVNDGLMAIFFFLIGLEIKRELMIGELNTVRKATFPFLAAIGGMILPVLMFLVLNKNPETVKGWGIPIATDIAFSLAILQMLGKRVPLSLKVFLTAFAIVDDLGAVMVIAIFYSTGIKWGLLAIGLIIILFLGVLSYLKIYYKYLVLALGIVVWVLFLKSGIHPTIAGVLLAFTIPIRQRTDLQTYTENLDEIVKVLQTCPESTKPTLNPRQIEIIDNLEDWTALVQSPLQHLEHKLHNWVAYFIMPIFALANAGVILGGGMNTDMALMSSLAISLILGKSIGISLISYIGIKLKIIELPVDVNMRQIIGVSFIAGVGFTMSIFIANLAFSDSNLFADSAKIGILAGSVIAGLLGYFILRTKNPANPL
jgi:Na+:H+ antiporter, NhaA family